MNQPCYNSIALARHQHNLDRQEAKEHWIAAAVDRLMDDAGFKYLASWNWHDDSYGLDFNVYMKKLAERMAEQEYQQHLSALEQARIDGEAGYE